jgi:phytoene dehydrogenase-like protein
MNLKEYGLEIVKRPISNFLPLDQTTYLKLGGGLERTQEEFRKFSKKDAEQLPEYYDRLEAVADVLRDLSIKTPPNPKQGLRAALDTALQLWPIATKGNQVHKDVYNLLTKSARSFLDSWFESEHVKAAFGFDSIVGNFASPDTPGSAYVLLHHVFGEVNGEKGAWGHAMGGMGAITQAMEKHAKKKG